MNKSITPPHLNCNVLYNYSPAQRLILMEEVCEILDNGNLALKLGNVSLFLYGYSAINVTENKRMLMSTIKYIKGTKRFSIQTDYT